MLKSWAVPKGPSFDPADKRLAMQTEDHPVDYGDFEGIIPEGEYGGGTVLLWDRGTWEPLEDPHKGLRAGTLKFRLDGEKLQGTWTLVKIKGRDAARRREELAAHQGARRARAAVRRSTTSPTARPESVATGRTLEEIAARPRPRLALEPAGSRATARAPRRRASRRQGAARGAGRAGDRDRRRRRDVPGARKAPLPRVVRAAAGHARRRAARRATSGCTR